MSLQDLPVELLHRICAITTEDGDHIAPFRLVCSLFAKVAAEHLMPEATIYFARESFDTARTIAARREIARGVRSLLFQAARLEPIQTFDEWQEQRWSSDPESNDRAISMIDHEMVLDQSPRGIRRARLNFARSHDIRRGHFSKAKLADAYEAFQRLYEDQGRMEREGEAQKAFATLFRSCPKLDEVTVSMAHELCVSTTKRVKAFQEAMIYPHRDHTTYYTGTHALQSLLLGAHEAGTRLRTLVVQPISHAFFELPLQVADKVYEAISRVEYLHIGLMAVFDDDSGNPVQHILDRMLHDVKQKKITKFLEKPRNVVKLTISAPEVSDLYWPGVTLNQLMGDCHLPRLENLTLRWFDCKEEDLRALLFRHSETLHTLELVKPRLQVGDWEHFFESIATKLPMLKSVRLRENFWQARDGDCLPFLECDDNPYDGFQDSEFQPETEMEEFRQQYTIAMESYVTHGGDRPSRDDWDLDDQDW